MKEQKDRMNERKNKKKKGNLHCVAQLIRNCEIDHGGMLIGQTSILFSP